MCVFALCPPLNCNFYTTVLHSAPAVAAAVNACRCSIYPPVCILPDTSVLSGAISTQYDRLFCLEFRLLPSTVRIMLQFCLFCPFLPFLIF